MPGTLLHLATRKGLFTLREEGDGDWRFGPPAFLGEPVSAVLADPRDGALYAALRLGHFGVKLHRSDDGGTTWTELPAPAFPPDPEAGETAPAVDMIWTLAPGGAAEPGVLWAGTLPAALFRSDDRGVSWTRVDGLWNVPERAEWMGGGYDHPGLHTILVDPRDPRRLTIAISTGGVWRSDDAGATWRLTGEGLRADYMPPARAYDRVVQDVHRLAWCREAPEVVWCQHHNGIFRSVDGRLVVTRTRDGGRSFEALGEGLPQQGAYDLIYRRALDVDATGTRLAMGSTTGSLWIGEEGGARWRLVSAHFPPIAQVAFA